MPHQARLGIVQKKRTLILLAFKTANNKEL